MAGTQAVLLGLAPSVPVCVTLNLVSQGDDGVRRALSLRSQELPAEAEGVRSWAKVGNRGHCCWLRAATALWPSEATWTHSIPGTLYERIFTPNAVYLAWQVGGSRKVTAGLWAPGSPCAVESQPPGNMSLNSGLHPETHSHRYPDAPRR